jgi:hypothetical protein
MKNPKEKMKVRVIHSISFPESLFRLILPLWNEGVEINQEWASNGCSGSTEQRCPPPSQYSPPPDITFTCSFYPINPWPVCRKKSAIC